MMIVTQAETIEAYLPLREDLAGITYASYVVELLDRFTYEEGEMRALYRLLAETMGRLVAEPDKELVIRYFELRLLDLVGFRPQLFNCLVCAKEIQPEDQYFSSKDGGVICPRCAPQAEGALPISLNALRALRHFQRSSYPEAKRLSLSPEVNREMEVIVQHYLTFLLERGLNTPPFLRRMRRIAEGQGDSRTAD